MGKAWDGGGGTFVFQSGASPPLIVAGGGGDSGRKARAMSMDVHTLHGPRRRRRAILSAVFPGKRFAGPERSPFTLQAN